MLLQGLFVPLTCPFYRDGASYLRKLEHNVARYSLGPVAGMVALPPDGEASALTDAEAKDALRVVGKTASKTKVLLAGVVCASVHAATEWADAAEKAKFDAIVLAPPTDWARLVRGDDARELLAFYQTVADRSPLPVVLWSDARPPALQLPVALIGSLARHRNVIGLIDADLSEERLAEVAGATGEVRREVTVTAIFEAVTRRMLEPERLAEAPAAFVTVEALQGGTAQTGGAASAVQALAPAVKTRTRTVGFQVVSAGYAHSIVPLLKAGAAGAAPALAACAPQACFEAYAAWKDGDLALAEERAGRLAGAEALLRTLGPAGVKAGCDFNGYFGGVPRLPRLPLTGEDRGRVELALAVIRN